jgi:hypothetical protein
VRDEEDDEDEKLFAELKRGSGKAPPSPRRGRKARQKDTFVQVPLWWMEQATKATQSPRALVCVWLLYLAWKAKGMKFPVPNGQLGKRGVDRRIKRRVLEDLEVAGLITVERRPGKTPIVTLTVL